MAYRATSAAEPRIICYAVTSAPGPAVVLAKPCSHRPGLSDWHPPGKSPALQQQTVTPGMKRPAAPRSMQRICVPSRYSRQTARMRRLTMTSVRPGGSAMGTEHFPGDGQRWHSQVMAAIEVVLGDITAQHVDAIVNAANESLRGGGGVDGAIHRAAGPRLAEAGAAIGPCQPGDAMATPAFGLDPPVRHVIHTVGPVWQGGGFGEAAVLASCYRRSLQVADELAARSVAFPAIATGIYGFPPGQAARIAVQTIRSTPTLVERVRLVAFDQPARDVLEAALNP